ncbi:hypothetical protein BH10ACT6_BH10ACT6_00690 [soil metagenome]
MTEEQREELMQLPAQAFGSPALMESLTDLDTNLPSLRATWTTIHSTSAIRDESVQVVEWSGWRLCRWEGLEDRWWPRITI